MKNFLQNFVIALFVLVGIVSCQRTTKNLLPPVAGKASDVLIVINTSLWKGIVGDSLRAMFSEEQIGLPQSEPVMNVLNVPHESFQGILKTYRGILDVRISGKIAKSNISIKKELWAKHQAYMKLEASTGTEMIQLIQKNRNRILTFFLSAEKERLMEIFKEKPVKEIFNKLKKEQKFTLACPSGYTFNKKLENFIWISKETPKTSQGLIIYTFGYNSKDVFTQNYLLAKRDSLLKLHIPGPRAGSYMTTERDFPISFRQFTFKGNYAVEMRGLWKVAKDFMGGPFVNISLLDTTRSRVVCLDSYVYYPNNDKRNLLRELEAIVYTFEFVE